MPEEPVCKLAPLIDRFQKIGELVTSIGGVDFPHDTAGTAVGQDAVYLPVYLLQIFQCLYIFTGIWHFFRPPGASFDPEHSSHSAQQPILLFEVGGLRIKDAILNVVGRGSSHREPGKTTEGEDLAPHQVEDIFPHLMYSAAVPFFFRQGVQQVEVLMVSVHEQGGEGFLSQPVQPMLVFLAAVPQPSKISIIPNSGQWRLYRVNFYTEKFQNPVNKQILHKIFRYSIFNPVYRGLALHSCFSRVSQCLR